MVGEDTRAGRESGRRTRGGEESDLLHAAADWMADHRGGLADPRSRDWAVRDYRAWLLTVRKHAPATVNNALAAIDDFYARRGSAPRPPSAWSCPRPRRGRWTSAPPCAGCARWKPAPPPGTVRAATRHSSVTIGPC